MITVYIASPYTKGDVAVNVRNQLEASDNLMELGYCPIVPLYSHFQHLVFPRHYEDWMKLDVEKVIRSDALLRLPGESPGADREVSIAVENGIPVAFSIEELQGLKVKERMLPVTATSRSQSHKIFVVGSKESSPIED